MSILPQYQRVPATQLDDDVVYDHHKSVIDDEPAPSYPPMPTSSSSGNHSNVVYTFIPRWPITGETQDALGMLGANKDVRPLPISSGGYTDDGSSPSFDPPLPVPQETVAMVQRGFPTLAEYPPDRIEFHVPVKLDGFGQPEVWGKVLDEAWGGFDRDPPTKLRVQVADLPGEERARHVDEVCRIVRLIGCVCGGIGIMLYCLTGIMLFKHLHS